MNIYIRFTLPSPEPAFSFCLQSQPLRSRKAEFTSTDTDVKAPRVEAARSQAATKAFGSYRCVRIRASSGCSSTLFIAAQNHSGWKRPLSSRVQSQPSEPAAPRLRDTCKDAVPAPRAAVPLQLRSSEMKPFPTGPKAAERRRARKGERTAEQKEPRGREAEPGNALD